MAKRLIKLLGEPIQNEDYTASAAITPGDLVAFASNGTVARNAVADLDLPRAFALEREEMGLGIDDDYAIGDAVKVGVFKPGTRVLAFIASGQNITAGNFLQAAADGTLKVYAAGARLAKALETSGAVTTKTRIRVEIM
jgi:hypothetical protein